MSDAPGGFRLSDVRDGSPAQKAGLKAGDVIFEFDGKPIRNLYDFTYALQSKKPGDEVTLKYRRNGQETETRAKLEARR
jgi:S1-C subfamily serine protease